MTEKGELDVTVFPEVEEQHRPRTIVFDRFTDQQAALLKNKGYQPVALISLPRSTKVDNIRWMKYILQGVSDGTVELDKARSEAVTLEMKMRGLLTGKEQNVDDDGIVADDSLESIFDWTQSKHQLEGTTTTVSLDDAMRFKSRMEELSRQAEVDQYKRPKRKKVKKRSR